MKTVFFTLFALSLFTPELSFAGPLRNCRPEDRLPGKRCADEWAVKDDQGGAGSEGANTDQTSLHEGDELEKNKD